MGLNIDCSSAPRPSSTLPPPRVNSASPNPLVPPKLEIEGEGRQSRGSVQKHAGSQGFSPAGSRGFSPAGSLGGEGRRSMSPRIDHIWGLVKGGRSSSPRAPFPVVKVEETGKGDFGCV